MAAITAPSKKFVRLLLTLWIVTTSSGWSKNSVSEALGRHSRSINSRWLRDSYLVSRVPGALQFQPFQYLPQYCHCLVGFVSPAEDDNIVRVSDYAGSQSLLQVIPFPYSVQYVQVEIGQQR